MNSRVRSLLPILLGLTIAAAGAQAADTWTGRRLSSVLDELRANGLPLLYSSQVVGDDLIIAQDPDAILQLDRLRLALQPLGLELQALEPASLGYAVVRSSRPVDAANSSTPETASTLMDEITVFASRYNLSREESNDVSAYLPHASLEKSAGIEQDVLRSVQYLPGASSNSLSALTHVRGAYEDENLVRFDGVELYKPVHMKDYQGLFGLLDPDWVESLNFYSGAYPVQFGNHNAAVIDIEPRTTSEPEYLLGGSLLYTRVLSTGSYNNAAGHWLLGYRRGNVAEVMRHTENDIGHPEFEDFVLHHSYALANGELRIGALRLNDDLELRTNTQNEYARSNDHDSYLWASWRQPWTSALNYSLQLTHSQLSGRRSVLLGRANIGNGELSDAHASRLFTLDASFNLHADEHTQWQWGAHVNRSRASYQYSSTAQYLTPAATTFGKPATAVREQSRQFQEWDYAGYLSLTRKQDAWRGELGLRYDVFPYLSHGTQLSPRLSVQYTLDAANTLHASAGNYMQAQALHMLDSSAATLNSAAPPERMRQYILGWTRTLSPAIQLRIEAYHKQGSRLTPRSENLLSFLTLASELEIDRSTFIATHSRAQGLEVSLTAPAQEPFVWSLSYSWSRVQDQIDGKYYRRSWDQPHALTASAHWSVARWLFSGNASWHSGWAYTPVLISDDGSSATLGTRNSQRFSDFVSLELRAQYTLPVRGANLQLFLELRNALGRSNECCRELAVDTSTGTPRISIQDEAALDVIPVAGFNLRF